MTANTTGIGPHVFALARATCSGARHAWKRARALTLPTLLVRGGLSDVLNEEGALHFLALSPHSEYVDVLSAGHMVAGDRNDVFGTSVIEFFKRSVLPDVLPQHSSLAR